MDRLEGRELLAGAGALDPSFGAGRGYVVGEVGEATAVFQRTNTTIAGVFARPDGKVVIAAVATDAAFGTGTEQFSLERLDADGSPDPSFGQGGVVMVPIPYATGFLPNGKFSTVGDAVVMQPDGKILEAGAMPTSGGTSTTFAVLRINVDGTIDTTYGNGGLATLPAGASTSITGVGSAALQPDGKLVLLGVGSFSVANSLPQVIGAVRLDADGSLDTGFGTGGTAALGPNFLAAPTPGAVAIQPDGGILAGLNENFGQGSPDSSTEAGLVRLDANGTVDAAFGGASGAPLGSRLLSFAVQPDGKIVALTSSPQVNIQAVYSLLRLDADGTLDTSFGSGGSVGPAVSFPTSVALQADGKVVVGGGLDVSPGGSISSRLIFAAARFNADGSIDPGFGNTSTPGLARYSLGASVDTSPGGSVTIQPDGNILLVGGVNPVYSPQVAVGRNGFAVARALALATNGPAALPPPATPPASFDGTGRTDLAVYLPAAGAFVYRSDNGAGDRVVPFGIAGVGQTIPAAADYAGVGLTQVAAYLPAFGDYAIRPAGGGPDQVFPFGIAGPGQSIPAPADYEGTGKADVAVYLPAFGAFGIRPSDGGPDRIVPFGIAGAGQSIPVPGDYTGDGKADLAVYLPAFGEFAIRPSEGGADQIIPFGFAGVGRSIPAPGDYDGSGRTELAVYLPSLGLLAYRPAKNGPDVLIPFGAPNSGEIPVPGDYTGSGHTEVAVYDPTFGTFAYRPADGSPDVIAAFGSAGKGASIPVAAPPTATAVASASAVSASAVGANAATARSSAIPAGPIASITARRSAGISVLQAKPDPTI